MRASLPPTTATALLGVPLNKDLAEAQGPATPDWSARQLLFSSFETRPRSSKGRRSYEICKFPHCGGRLGGRDDQTKG